VKEKLNQNIYSELGVLNARQQFRSRILAIDPSGTGTSGFCLVKDGIISFLEFKSSF